LSTEPGLTVVIGSSAPPERLDACLSALEPQIEGVEVLVHETVTSPPSLRDRYPWARFTTSEGALVPHLWRDGIDAASCESVALTIAPMQPAPDWVDGIRGALSEHDAIGGAIEPADGLPLVDLAEFLCRYARDMRPFEARENVDIPGDNAAYRRTALELVRDTYRDGFWENVVDRRLADLGVMPWHTPAVVVSMGRSAGFRAFVRQRLAHGRLYGHQRGAHFGRGRNLVGVLASPAVPFLMTLRVYRELASRRRLGARTLLALPVVFTFNVVWAVAEARGHADLVRRR
jgi:hypothetical protein